ncbi:unnamed protein product [Spirodela intermedia]|uniref:Uncharacterized protein n=1 Tax=Spirodela intermedia TaxID=51605 RepID=A0A7I8K9U8_SPIIN|nr:unnamed protein product [Spirodela intermedia]
MGHRIVSNGCHPAEWKNGNLVTLRWLSPNGEELDRGGMRNLERSRGSLCSVHGLEGTLWTRTRRGQTLDLLAKSRDQ